MESNYKAVKPMEIEVGGKKYVLEFSKSTVRYAERMGVSIGQNDNSPITMITLLFHCAFKMHQPDITIEETDAIYDEIGGLYQEEVDKILELYKAQAGSIIRGNDAGERKNVKISL